MKVGDLVTFTTGEDEYYGTVIEIDEDRELVAVDTSDGELPVVWTVHKELVEYA